jgi:hypothetical protein
MAKKIFYSDLSIANNELLDARIENKTTTERTSMTLSTDEEGLAVWDTVLNALYVWDGTQWVRVGASITDIDNWNQAYDDSVTDFTISQGINTTFTISRRNSSDLVATYKSSYEHLQNSPSNTWVITHNLNKRPSITVIDSGGNEVEGAVTIDSLNQITIVFCGAFSGKALLN